MNAQSSVVYVITEAGNPPWQSIALKTLQRIAAQDSCTLSVVESKAFVFPTNAILYPLTLDVPDELEFSGRSLFQQCQDLEGLRLLVNHQFGIATGEGSCWLPIVLTARGPLYAEAIAFVANSKSYQQPLHLSDRQRQPLYQFGFQLLQFLKAIPAVYLLQFSFQGETLCFDRLFPFPAEMAIASLSVQTPDLFTCHWRCLRGQPITDLRIDGSAAFLQLQG
jgi:hypothetical protein